MASIVTRNLGNSATMATGPTGQMGSQATRSSWAIGVIGQPPGCPRILLLPLLHDRAVWFDLCAARKKTIIVRHFRIAPSTTKFLVTERPCSVPHRNASTCTASGVQRRHSFCPFSFSDPSNRSSFLRHNDLVLVKPCVPSRPGGNEDMDMGADATWSSIDGRTDVHPESFTHCAERKNPFQALLPRTLNFASTLQMTPGSMDSPKMPCASGPATLQSKHRPRQQTTHTQKTHTHTHTSSHNHTTHIWAKIWRMRVNIYEGGQRGHALTATHLHGAPGTVGCSVYLDTALMSLWTTEERTMGLQDVISNGRQSSRPLSARSSQKKKIEPRAVEKLIIDEFSNHHSDAARPS